MCCRNHIAKMAWPFWLKLVSTDFGKFEFRSPTLAFALCFSAMAPKSFAAAASGEVAMETPRHGMDETMDVDVPPSTLESEMLSEGSFQLVDPLTEITTADYQMAEQVAETHKNEEDAASLTLSGAPLDERDATTIHKLEAGPELSDFICEHCKSPWLKPQQVGKCMGHAARLDPAYTR